MPALRLANIEVRRRGQVALSIPELTVAPGEVITLVGPNGAGKSTLLQVAALLHPPDRGEIWIGGERVSRRTTHQLRRRTAMVFQAPLLFDAGVLANVAAGLRFRGVKRHDAERAGMASLDHFRVGHLAGRPARSLSGGEAQRVSLARAFAVEPSLLLLDEPFAALDQPTRAALLPELAARLRASRVAAIVVTHDQTEALAIGTRLGILLDGRIAQLGTPGDVVARPASLAVARFLGIANLLPGTVAASDGDGVTVNLAGGSPVRVSDERPMVTGEPVHLAIHARQIALHPPGAIIPPGWNQLSGSVSAIVITPAGQDVTVTCHDGGARIVAAMPPANGKRAVEPGDQVIAAFAPISGAIITTREGTAARPIA
jgi:tungstate transport system ATP-binding protein